MSPEQIQFHNLNLLPLRLDVQQAAWFFGCEKHNICALVAERVLKPLGHPSANGTKYFATADLEKLRSDARLLARGTDAIYSHWRIKNAHKGKKATPPPEIDHA